MTEHRTNTNRYAASRRGFSLIELMVATALFAVVMLVSTGALISLVDATRKAQALQSVMNNLNIALDGMVRAIRMGSTYHCGASGTFTDPRDCLNGDTLVAFEPFGGDPDTGTDQWVYRLNGSRLEKSESGGSGWVPVTAPEVSIDELTFYVEGTARGGNTQQPRVIITVRGTAGAEKAKTTTTFNIQATAAQRVLDL